jgi:hypothetical protein
MEIKSEKKFFNALSVIRQLGLPIPTEKFLELSSLPKRTKIKIGRLLKEKNQ